MIFLLINKKNIIYLGVISRVLVLKNENIIIGY